MRKGNELKRLLRILHIWENGNKLLCKKGKDAKSIIKDRECLKYFAISICSTAHIIFHIAILQRKNELKKMSKKHNLSLWTFKNISTDSIRPPWYLLLLIWGLEIRNLSSGYISSPHCVCMTLCPFTPLLPDCTEEATLLHPLSPPTPNVTPPSTPTPHVTQV